MDRQKHTAFSWITDSMMSKLLLDSRPGFRSRSCSLPHASSWSWNMLCSARFLALQQLVKVNHSPKLLTDSRFT